MIDKLLYSAYNRNCSQAPLAQLVEQLTLNQKVRGSIPRWRTTQEIERFYALYFFDMNKIIQRLTLQSEFVEKINYYDSKYISYYKKISY